MIKRIIIKDYMAHHHTVLELGSGVTVLTGPNNVGKSAVVEAIRSVAQNPAPEHVIRHGANQAVVRLELDSGEVIEWVRKKANAVYRLYRPGVSGAPASIPSPQDLGEPEVYAKFGRMPPDDVRQLLRLDLVETESGPVDIHIGNQRYPIFLLDQSGSQAASFFAASTEAEYLLRMRQALKTRTDSSKRQVNQLRQECLELEKELQHYAPLAGIDADLRRTEAMHVTLQDLQRSLPVLAVAIERLRHTERQRVSKQKSTEVLGDLSPPPPLHDIATPALRLEEWRQALEHRSAVQGRSQVLILLTEPPPVWDNGGLDALLTGLEGTERGLQRQNRLLVSLIALSTPPDLHPTGPLESMVMELHGTGGALALASAQGLLLEPLTAPPTIHEPGVLEQFISQLRATAHQHRKLSHSSEALSHLTSSPEPYDVRGLEAMTGMIEQTTGRCRRVSERQSLLDGLQPCPEPADAAELEETLGRLARLGQDLLDREQDLRACEADLETLRGEIHAALADAGNCPLCGQTLDLVHFLESVHA